MKKLLLLLVVWVGVLIETNACSCYPEPFCNSVAFKPNDAVLMGKILSFDATDTLSLKLHLLGTFRGQENRDTIVVWAGTGIDCNGWVSAGVDQLGSIGDTVIFMATLLENNNVENSWDVVGDYRSRAWFGVGQCLSPNLRIENGIVHGRLYATTNPYWHLLEMPFADFVAGWDNGQFTCKTPVGINEMPVSEQKPILFPNPATDKLTIQLPAGASFSGACGLVLTDITGRKLMKQAITNSAKEIWVRELPQGLYLITITSAKGENWQQKLVLEK